MVKRIIDDSCSSFWKLYLNNLLSNKGGLFVFNCNYAVDKLNISDFYYNCYYDGQNYETLLIVMVNINILYGTTEKLRSTVKVCFINDTYQKVLTIPKIYFMIGQILTP